MTQTFATGKYSYFVCDMCSFSYPYLTAQKSSYGTMRCPFCNDGQFDLKNHPQNSPPPVTPDPEALRDPRPEVNLDFNTVATEGDEMTPINVGGGGP